MSIAHLNGAADTSIARSLTPSAAVDDRHSASADEESLKNVWRTLRRRKVWILCFAAGFAALGLLASLLMTPQYLSTAIVQVGKDETVQVPLANDAAAPTLSESDTKTDIATHMSVLEDPTTAFAVSQSLDLESDTPFKFHPSLRGWLTGTNKENEAEMHLPLSQAPFRRDRLTAIFQKKLTVKNIPDTRLITVSFLSPDRNLAAKIANAAVAQYIKFESDERGDNEGLRVLNAQLAKLRTQMNAAQTRLADYERQTGLNSLILKSVGQGGGGGSVTHIPALDRLDALNQALTMSEENRISKQAIYDVTRTHRADAVMGLETGSTTSLSNSAVVNQGGGLQLLDTLRQQANSLRTQYASEATKYGAHNPHLIELKTQLQSINQQMSEELDRINERAANDYLVAQRNEDTLRKAFNQQQATAGKLNQNAVVLEGFAQQAASSREIYEALNRQIEQARVQAGLRATNIRIVSPAVAASEPSRPLPVLYTAVAFLVGLLIGIATAFIREHMDETVKTPMQVDSLTPLPVLATIPRLKMPRLKQLTRGENASLLNTGEEGGSGESSPLILYPRSAEAEAYRALRTAVTLAPARGPIKTLLVSSPLTGEGKTTVSYNVAIALAHAGERVLLIDADLHHPHLQKEFNVPLSPGLSELLTEDVSLPGVIRPHATVNNLFLLPAGGRIKMSAEQLGSGKFDSLLGELKQGYDMIIIDTPPMLLVTDAQVLASKVDAILAVVRSDVTNQTVVERLSEVLRPYGDRSIGLVLNDIDPNSIDFYQAFGHNVSEKYFESVSL